MASYEYSAPGVDVIIERGEVETQSAETEFYPVFVGTGISSRNHNVYKENLRGDTSKFPLVTISFDILGDINTDLFNKMSFSVGQVDVQRSSYEEGEESELELLEDEGFEVTKPLSLSSTDSTASLTIRILDDRVAPSDVTYGLNLLVNMADKDFEPRAIGTEDRFFSKEMFGPVVISENGVEFYNDIAIACEIAFRLEVPRFYYLEVPRNYGEAPTASDFKAAIDKIYFYNDAYRIVPLTPNADIASVVNQFVAGVSNPIDRRESVAFVTYDTTKIENINDIQEVTEKVGSYSQSFDNKRICNVFSGESLEMRIDGELYVIPSFFMSVAVASLDAVVGRVDPLSLREINVFEKVNGPRFRPRQWDQLAKQGVFIVMQDNPKSPAIIRHQLTTSKSALPEDQEYSVVKNFDVVVKKIRDRFSPYAGKYNVETGFIERLEGTLATVRQEILEDKLARDLAVITSWQQRSGSDGRNLVTRLQLSPVYPANDLDVYLIV